MDSTIDLVSVLNTLPIPKNLNTYHKLYYYDSKLFNQDSSQFARL